MRLFISILPEGRLLEALAGIQSALARSGVAGRFAPKENLHLTLAFIGEYPDPDAVLEIIKRIPFTPFRIELDGLGTFGDTLWTGVKPDDAMFGYVSRLRRALADAGIPFDHKRFRPHITLARRADLGRKAPAAVHVPRVAMTAERASLMRSIQVKGTTVYTEIK